MTNWAKAKLDLIKAIEKDVEEAKVDGIPRNLEVVKGLNKVYRAVKEVLEKHRQIILEKSK